MHQPPPPRQPDPELRGYLEGSSELLEGRPHWTAYATVILLGAILLTVALT